MTYTLVAVDVKGIQHYLFGSNKLQENIGASEIVAQATEHWVYDSLTEWRHNFKSPFNPLTDDWYTGETIEAGQLEVEVIYAGGGNAVLIFTQPEQAKQFTQALTQKAILEAPGLDIAVAHQSFDWNQSLCQAYQDLMERTLARRKAAYFPSVPLLGVGVTAVCQSTGLPAVALDPNETGRIISAETKAKLVNKDKAEARYRKQFEVTPERRLRFIKDFNEIGTKNEASYIAVVHADGNGIGGRFKEISQNHPSAALNRPLINQLRRFSQSLRRAASLSLKEVIDKLVSKVDWPTQKLSHHGIEIDIQEDEGEYILPVRPLVVGGDDTTFVCDGRLGLTMATLYLQAFQQQRLDDDLNLASHACAGVAIVHNHYPFARAYSLSETLCNKAKGYVRQSKRNTGLDISALDWHFGVNGILEDLATIRQRDYMVQAGQLFIRPVRLTEPERDPLHSWQTFRYVTDGFQRNWNKEKRNKLKKLRDVLRDGPQATKLFLLAYDLKGKLPEIEQYKQSFQEFGWQSETGGTCGYFDAIEAVDFFVDLEEVTG